jgi:hypothetical protein
LAIDGWKKTESVNNLDERLASKRWRIKYTLMEVEEIKG